MNVIEHFLRWLTPYKYDDIGTKPSKKNNEKENKKEQEINAKEHVEKGLLGISISNMAEPLELKKAKERLLACPDDKGYFIHTHEKHQLGVRFAPDSAFRYQHRSDSVRKKLKPLIYPLSKVSYDRTHLIPIGFHGSESDDRLLVGWNSELNRGQMNEWEKNVKKYNKKNTILWFVDIERNNDDSVTWKAIIWNDKGKKVMDAEWTDDSKFVWL